MNTKKILQLCLLLIIIPCIVYGVMHAKRDLDTKPLDSFDYFNASPLMRDDWEYSAPSAQGTQFMYPKVLPTKYVSATEWPPKLEMTAGEYVCQDTTVGNEYYNSDIKKITIGDREYCLTRTSEGAAGSTYTSFTYKTQQGDFVPQLTFTLRYPQCMNYDDPEQSLCKNEQAGLNVDQLASEIIRSIRMH